jgi:hypothetical protein
MGTVLSNVKYIGLELEVYSGYSLVFSGYFFLDYILLCAVCFLAHGWLVLDILW